MKSNRAYPRTAIHMGAIALAVSAALCAAGAFAADEAARSHNPKFDSLDKNHDGFLTMDEVRHIRDFPKAFTEADQNKDGKLDRDEFIKAEAIHDRILAGKYADELVLTMNRAAEAAVPEAKKLFVDAVKKMSVQDAKGVLTGGQTAGTEYFKRSTTDQLRARFLPIVKNATAKVKLAEKYNQYAQKGVQFGLVKKEQANLDDYVTQKALDGLFYMVAEEEKKIRQDPVKAGSDIIRKVFGALK